MGKKRLDVLVNGKLIGELTMTNIGNNTTAVEGRNLIHSGLYSMDFGAVEDITYRRVNRDYEGENIEIRETKYKI